MVVPSGVRREEVDEILIVEIVRLGGSEINEGKGFPGHPAELALDEAVAESDPKTGGPHRRQHGRQGGVFQRTGDREQMPAADFCIRFCLQPGEAATDCAEAARPGFESVAERVPISVRQDWTGAQRSFGPILQSIAIGIGQQRIRAGGKFPTVIEAIVIGIRIIGIGAGEDFLGVVLPVVVRIEGAVVKERIQPQIGLLAIADPVPVIVIGARTDIKRNARQGERRASGLAGDDE